MAGVAAAVRRDPQRGGVYWRFFLATAAGLALAPAIAWLTDLYTSEVRAPVAEMAETTRTEAANFLLAGPGFGLEGSVWAPVAAANFAAFLISQGRAAEADSTATAGIPEGMRWYCTVCWKEIPAGIDRCPSCGAPVDRPPSYLDGLLRALRSPEGETVIRAAYILGALRDPRAVGPLGDVVRHGDPYAAAEAVRTLARIGTPEAQQIVRAALAHPFAVVRATARERLA